VRQHAAQRAIHDDKGEVELVGDVPRAGLGVQHLCRDGDLHRPVRRAGRQVDARREDEERADLDGLAELDVVLRQEDRRAALRETAKR